MTRRADWMQVGLLAAAWLLASGASPEGVEQARRWQYQGDLAQAGGLDEIAYVSYERIHRTFPGTRHGNLAADRMRNLRSQMAWPRQSPAQENPGSWTSEVFDFLVWP